MTFRIFFCNAMCNNQKCPEKRNQTILPREKVLSFKETGSIHNFKDVINVKLLLVSFLNLLLKTSISNY